jgi:hypothetical protein
VKAANVGEFAKALETEKIQGNDVSPASLQRTVEIVIDKFGDLIALEKTLSPEEIVLLFDSTSNWFLVNLLRTTKLDQPQRVTDFIFFSLLPKAKGRAFIFVSSLVQIWSRNHVVEVYKRRREATSTRSEVRELIEEMMPPSFISAILQKIIEVEFSPDFWMKMEIRLKTEMDIQFQNLFIFASAN